MLVPRSYNHSTIARVRCFSDSMRERGRQLVVNDRSCRQASLLSPLLSGEPCDSAEAVSLKDT